MERLTKRNLHDFAIPTQGTDAFHLLQTVDRLAAIEDILGDEYDLDRLCELVQADRDGQCYIVNVKIGEQVFVPDKKGKVIACRVQGISLPAHGKNLIIHLGGYPAEYLWSDREGKDWWKTRESAEAALKGEQGG